jgi:hypothetical protein
MSEESDREGSSADTSSAAEGVDIGRRETLQLATLAAALGAGLAVSFHAEPASADGAQQLQFKFYREQEKGRTDLVLAFTAALPEDASKKLLSAPGGRLQLKCYGTELLGASPMQIKVAAPAPAPAPSAPAHWDVRANKKV